MDFKAFILTYKKEGVGQTHVNLSLWSTLAWFSAQIGGRHSDWRRSSKRRPYYYYIQYCALCSMASKLFNTCLKFLLCADNFLINLTWWSSWSNPLCLAKFLQKWNQFLPKKYYLIKKLAVDKKICESKSQIELLNRDNLIVVG